MGNTTSTSVADVYAQLPQIENNALPRRASARAKKTTNSELYGAVGGLMIEVSIRNSQYRTLLISSPQWLSFGSCVVLRVADQNWIVLAQRQLKTHISVQDHIVYLDSTGNNSEAGWTASNAICFLPSICEAFNAQLEALRETVQPLELSRMTFDAIDLKIRDNVPFRAVTDGSRVKIASMPTWLAEQQLVRFVDANGAIWIFARVYGMKTFVKCPTFIWEQRNVPGKLCVQPSKLVLLCEAINEAIKEQLQSAPEAIADANLDEPIDYNVDCVVCLDTLATRAFLPCGHKCVCGICSSRFNGSSCPLCKTEIKRIVRIY